MEEVLSAERNGMAWKVGGAAQRLVEGGHGISQGHGAWPSEIWHSEIWIRDGRERSLKDRKCDNESGGGMRGVWFSWMHLRKLLVRGQ